MHGLYLKTYVNFRNLKDSLQSESGQDLVEYALVVALIALAAAAGMSGIVTQINAVFTVVGTRMQA